MTTPTRPESGPESMSGQSATDKARKTADELTDKAKDTADSAIQSATKTATAQANAAKSSVSDEISGVASALRTAAEEMRSGSPQERTFGQIAEGLADASDALRDKDLDTMVQDVTRFARKNPLVFLGGAVLIGFAATRFAKASGSSDEVSSGQYGASASTPGVMS
jgi:gas vesicle protein